MKKFICYFHFVGFNCLSLGIHFDIIIPNMEIHLPFGFIRIGWHDYIDKDLYERFKNERFGFSSYKKTFSSHL